MLITLLYVETMSLSLTQSSQTSYKDSKESATLEGAKTLATKASGFILPQDNFLPTLESLKM
jgi:hypothetical protein